MATTTKITLQQYVGVAPSGYTVSKYPKLVVNLGTSITGVTVGDLTDAVTKTAASAALAKQSEINAAAAATAAKTSETNAKRSETQALGFAGDAAASKANAKVSETNAAASAVDAENSAQSIVGAEANSAASAAAAKVSETNAKTSETNAAASAALAKESETKSKTSETKSKTSETNAAASAAAAKVSETNAGTSAGTADTEADRAKAEADRATQIVDSKLDKEDIAHFIKTYETLAEAQADVVNRVLNEKILVWSQSASKYGWYKVTGTASAPTLTLQTEELKLITVNNVRPDNSGNVQVTIPGGNPSLWLGELTFFPYDKDNGIGYSGVLPADGRIVNRVDYPDVWLSISTGLIPSVTDAEWLAGKNMFFSKGDNTLGTFRLPNMMQGQAFRAPVVNEADTAELQVQVPYVTMVNGKSPDEATGAVVISGSDLNGTVPVTKGGTGAATVADARTALLVDRLVQGTTSTTLGKASGYRFAVNDSGDWGVLDGSSNWDALAIAQGGTGAVDARNARINLGLDRFNQSPTETAIFAQSGRYALTVNNSGAWGCYDITAANTAPLTLVYGGTGARNAADARKALGLVSSSDTVPVTMGGTGSNNATDARDALGLKVDPGYRGADGTFVPQARYDFRMITSYDSPLQFPLGITAGIQDGDRVGASSSYVAMINVRGWTENSGITSCAAWYAGQGNSGIGVRIPVLSGDGNWYYQNKPFYHSGNTTKAADGTLKAASPIVKIFADGTAETNGESEGALVERLDVGQYLITNILGTNSDAGWGGIDGGFDIPTDRNKQPLIWLDYKVNVDGSVLVKTYHRTYPNAPVFAQNIKEGYSEADPIDIPSDQFVSVRVEMPEDSIYNTKLREDEEARILAEKEQEEKRIWEEQLAKDEASNSTQETTLDV